jgi:hypothetical protein
MALHSSFVKEPILEAPPGLAAGRRRWRRWLFWPTAAVLLIVLGCLSAGWYVLHRNQLELREAEAEADRDDPGWRFEELEGSRMPVSDAENSALRLQAAAALLPPKWPTLPIPGPEFFHAAELPANVRPGPKLLALVRTAVSQAGPALDSARQLSAYRRGHHAIALSRNSLATLLPHLQQIQQIKRLLFLDALAQIEDRDETGGATACLAIVSASRSVADEPFLVSQLNRIGCQLTAVRAVERLLAQGEPAEAVLLQLQSQFEEEAAQPVTLLAFRSMRATIHQSLLDLETGDFDRRALALSNPYGLPDRAFNLNDAFRATASHAAFLRYLNRVIEILKLPPEQQRQIDDLPPPTLGKLSVARLLEVRANEVHDIHQMCLGATVMLRCAVTAVAVERYRRKTGAWPQRLSELAPAYLPAEPLDPFSGQPSRYRACADGVEVSSVGDGKGNRALQFMLGAGKPTDLNLAVRLWDLAGRRQQGRKEFEPDP